MAAALAFVSSLLWGTGDFLGGLAARRLRPVAVVAWSQAAALVALLIAVPVRVAGGQPLPADADWALWAVIGGAAGALGLVVFYAALATGTNGVVSPIAAMGGIVPVLAGLLLGEPPSALQVSGMVLGLAGVVLAGGPELAGGARARSVLLAAGSGVLFGAALAAIQRGAQSDVLLTLLGMRLTSVAAFAGAALVARSLGGIAARDLPGLAVVGLFDVGANALFAVASTVPAGSGSVVAALGALYPVATVVLARIVLGERLTGVQRVGVTVALAGVVLLAAG